MLYYKKMPRLTRHRRTRHKKIKRARTVKRVMRGGKNPAAAPAGGAGRGSGSVSPGRSINSVPPFEFRVILTKVKGGKPSDFNNIISKLPSDEETAFVEKHERDIQAWYYARDKLVAHYEGATFGLEGRVSNLEYDFAALFEKDPFSVDLFAEIDPDRNGMHPLVLDGQTYYVRGAPLSE